MTIQNYSNDKIHDNPYQVAGRIDPAEVAELADSIKEHGLKRVPTARPHPEKPGHIQIIEGHRRRAAWFARSKEPMPFDVLAGVDDRTMFENNVIENSQRQDLNVIQKARQLQAYINAFSATQAAAGKLFGLGRQGSVSNVLRLLELPEVVLDLVAAGKLAERNARQLIFLSRLDKKKAVEVALNATDEKSNDAVGFSPEDVILDEMDSYARKHGRVLANGGWDLNWKPKDLQVAGAPAPACTGCPMRHKGKWQTEYCMQPACFDAKKNMHVDMQATKAAKRLKIPLAGKDEKVTVLFKGDYHGRVKARQLVGGKARHLRLVPDTSASNAWARKDVLGSEHVALATVDAEAAKKFLTKPKTKNYQDDWKKEQEAREQRGRQIAALVESSAPIIASALPADAGVWYLLDLGADTWHYRKEIKKAKSVREKRLLIVKCLLGTLEDARDTARDKPTKVRAELLDLARLFKVKLPVGWDAALSAVGARTNGKTPAAAKAKAKGKKK